jgi:S-adenosylmethionine decarboxylase
MKVPVENNISNGHFGEHVTIDGYGGDHLHLNDEKLVLSCLQELCDLLGMKPLMEPKIISAPDNNIKDPGGWSGFLVIAESHISIHTFPKRAFISADVYTCQNGIDQNKIVNFLKLKFHLKDVESQFIRRGTKYPAQNIF